MLPKLEPFANHHGRDVTGRLPDAASVVGISALPPAHDVIWQRAAPYLAVRNNDEHTIYSYGLARALVDLHPDADPEVVLPGILLHDTGWSAAPADEVLTAIAPGGNRPDLVLLHEKEGARIGREILEEVGHDAARIEEIVGIIDGHDSRHEALSLNDALVKDADKLWRLTPHGVDTVMDWFGLTREQAHRLIGSRVHDHLFTDAARTMARALAAVAWVDASEQRVKLG
ncbi:HD domain-containing protein [Planosporangium thailandense]|uniref:HD domain-containing protein n=1 Tax=Planosporangium thailandense TaxID=765197 RepID=A0ABX0Y657_9ACTN|nr:HD domain-containing protein [Planosporangium thailandense]NJC73045.1 HD domain-containing protein [Planosporangium thailandense]